MQLDTSAPPPEGAEIHSIGHNPKAEARVRALLRGHGLSMVKRRDHYWVERAGMTLAGWPADAELSQIEAWAEQAWGAQRG